MRVSKASKGILLTWMITACSEGVPTRSTILHPGWRLDPPTRSGVALVYTDRRGSEWEIRCRAAPADLQFFSASLKPPVDSHLVLVVGREQFPLRFDDRHDGSGAYAYGFVTPRFLAAARAGRPVSLLSGGEQTRLSEIPASLSVPFAAACDGPL